jgi:hypothetical protein
MFADAAIAVPPYFQDFSSGKAGWRQTSSGADPLAAVASGGPDGGAYVSAASSVVSGGPVLFRANVDYPGIDTSFSGNWIAAGVRQISAYVRSSATEPLQFFTRVTETGTNFPGLLYISPTLVQPNIWTKVDFNVTDGSPDLNNAEGASYSDVFSDVGNFQFGVSFGASPAAGSYTYDLDKVDISLTPEPASGALAACSALAVALRIRRQKQAARN